MVLRQGRNGQKELKAEFNNVNAAGKLSKMFVDHGQQNCAIVDIDDVLQLFQQNCQIQLCPGQCTVAS